MAHNILLSENTSDLAAALISDFEALSLGLQAPDLTPLLAHPAQLAAKIAQDSPRVLINSLSYHDANLNLQPLVAACIEQNLILLHISSIEVFAPQTEAQPRLEQDIPNASHPRGLALIAAEQAVQQVPRHIILRLPFVVSPAQGTWLDQLCKALSGNTPVPVSESQRLDPISLGEASRILIALIQQILCGAENWGVLHIHTADTCAEAEFADHLVRMFRKEQLPAASLDPVKGPSLWLPPAGVLGGIQATNQFGIQMRTWRHGLKYHVMQWLEAQRQGELF